MEPIDAIWKQLGEQERAILLRLGNKMLRGKEKYGEWKPLSDSRRYVLEALDELVDCTNYLMAEALRIEGVLSGEDSVPPKKDRPSARKSTIYIDPEDRTNSRHTRAVGYGKTTLKGRRKAGGQYRRGKSNRIAADKLGG